MRICILCLLFAMTACAATQSNNPSAPANRADKTSGPLPETQNHKRSVSNDQRVTPPAIAKEIAHVSFCQLLQSPEKFEQQLVRVKAIFRRGFEKSEFYSLKCPTDKHVWVSGGTNTKCPNAGRLDETNFDGGERTVGVVVVGKLTGTKGNYGHLGAADYEFTIDCVERYEVLDRKSNAVQILTAEQLRKVEEFEGSN